jgi:hypothetical protein
MKDSGARGETETGWESVGANHLRGARERSQEFFGAQTFFFNRLLLDYLIKSLSHFPFQSTSTQQGCNRSIAFDLRSCYKAR